MFYDLTKDGTLSPVELFKHRIRKHVVIPSRGGQKDFEPDGSWLQKKSLEAFLQEKTAAISEPRVEKLKNLVEGEWNEEKRLVDLKKAGKFWMHMGFTDDRRNWLYPEEAIFLIETNTLEVYRNGCPMSIQEAYHKMLGKDVSVEEYQVFSHLRRLGYVVLRHEESQVLTDYERQINLERSSKKKGRKWKRDMMAKSNSAPDQDGTNEGENCTQETDPQEEKCETANDDMKEDQASTSKVCENDQLEGTTTDNETGTGSDLTFDESKNNVQASDIQNSQDTCAQKRPRTEEGSGPASPLPAMKRQKSDNPKISDGQTDKTEPQSYSTADTISKPFEDESNWSSCFVQGKTISGDKPSCLKQTNIDPSLWDFFPDISNKGSVVLQFPDLKLIPNDVVIDENSELLQFDVDSYRQKFPRVPQNAQELHENAREARVKNLQFSFAEWNDKKIKTRANNWHDLKKKTAERISSLSTSSPMAHLWKGSITPLVHPNDALSYDKMLEKLRVVQSASNDTLANVSQPMKVKVKISYDVHLPDRKFRKSMPGVPNHRVCVTRPMDGPPTLVHFMSVCKNYKDNVPLHWAVVDAGEIAFYVFDHSSPIETVTQMK